MDFGSLLHALAGFGIVAFASMLVSYFVNRPKVTSLVGLATSAAVGTAGTAREVVQHGTLNPHQAVEAFAWLGGALLAAALVEVVCYREQNP